RGTAPLDVDKEEQSILSALQEGAVGRKFVVRSYRNVRADNFVRYILDSRPSIVHFSGHGTQDRKILLEDERGESWPVSADALGRAFRAAVEAGQPVECVMLNTCFSTLIADALLPYVRCVIGMPAEIDSSSAQAFSTGFYRGIG